MKKVKTTIFLILALLFLIILIQNTGVVTIHLLFWQTSVSFLIFIVLMVLIGSVLGYIVAKTRRRCK